MKKIFRVSVFSLTATLMLGGCLNLDEKTFDRIDANTFYQNELSVKGAIASIYFNAANGFTEHRYHLAEIPADQLGWRVWNGGLWGYDEGEKYVLSVHSWTADSKIIDSAWKRAWTTIGLCNQVIVDLEDIDAAGIGMTPEKVKGYIAEVRTLRAWQYYCIFELWGGALPLNIEATSNIPGSADPDFNEGCKKIYDFIATELDESLDDLLTGDSNRMNKAANRVLKAKLLLNAGVFIGEDHFSECAAICEEIMKGTYGNYSIAPDYRTNYSVGNNKSPEMIFCWAMDDSHRIDNMFNLRGVGIPSSGLEDMFGYTPYKNGWNCYIVNPSYDNSGNVLPDGGTDGGRCFLDAPYNDHLGAAYARFSDKDIRKQNYRWEGGNYNGMFIMGAVKNYATGEPYLADADRDKNPLVYVDQLGTFLTVDASRGKGGTAPTSSRQLETVMSPRWGETNSGYRFLRYPIAPAAAEKRIEDIHEVEIRYAEVVYMLAECRLRAGNSSAAKDLVNSVRQRYFTAADWTAEKDNTGRCSSSYDLVWMLDQWGQEFLGEGCRRRTDLRRFDEFTQGQWWFFGRATEDVYSLPAKRDRKYEWYPLPTSALTVNPGLVQNPAYK